jgi:hypothetical protein
MRTSMSVFSMVLAAAFTLPACDGNGDGGGLTPDDVRSIPPGDATGNALSGEYEVTRTTRACSGRCAATVSGFLVAVCDVGEIVDSRVTVTQTDGDLEVLVDDDVPALYRGGIQADGAYDLGAYATQNGATIEITVRSQGTITASSLTGTARSATWGSIEGQSLDCAGEYEVRGLRR